MRKSGISCTSRSRLIPAVCLYGWLLRLAINVDPEILIVDEALSVGDVFFQSKCYRRMEEIRQKGNNHPYGDP